MENILEYHPFIGMKNVLITNNQQHYKITNPYVYPIYLKEKKDYIMNPMAAMKKNKKWKPEYDVSARSRMQDESLDPEFCKMQEFHKFQIKKNVFQVMSIILCLGTDTKENLYYEENSSRINTEYISSKIDRFNNRYRSTETQH